MNNEKTTCCFSGHRIIPQKDIEGITKTLKEVIDEYIKKGYTRFISGGALGFDLLAARLVAEKRKEIKNIKLIMILPCRDQHKKWSETDKKEYEKILSLADEVEYVCENYCTGCMHLRNKTMVDRSGVVFAYLTSHTGGTAHTVNYATEKGKDIVNIAYRL